MQTIEQMKQVALDALEELKGEDIVTMEIGEQSSIADYMIVCSARSSRHLAALADEVTVKSKHAGFQPLSVNKASEKGWVLVDLGDVIVHIMTPETREFYSLEKLWQKRPDTVSESGSEPKSEAEE
jgi:ribosome-associated protein